MTVYESVGFYHMIFFKKLWERGGGDLVSSIPLCLCRNVKYMVPFSASSECYE